MDQLIDLNYTNLIKKKKNLFDAKDCVTDETSVFSEKAQSINNNISQPMAEWSIVYFETDVEENIEGFNDLIPFSWITKGGTLGWYPMNEHQATLYNI